ncbi:cell division protein FtsL [Aestuariirhabdus sp. Z084]|uniref:cell division protein FtsL n=1 Tax=Aestuariirhabdus haliotis TaxID=2918751 RepID=UPI00201B35C3|nr:cell division protein FtsL [Aestuariirhabdus haliotis]MCL6415918.1 cell division protein FtsL [Aestuariirhabdus haliotis]MCL6419916.1 cell division protein FtsL [Aestuariirhabdus haliotis]
MVKSVWQELICKQHLLMVLLLVMVAVSALLVTYTAHLNRLAFNELMAERNSKHQAQVQWGQLLLQHSTLTTPSRIENLARKQLNMNIPHPKDTIMVVQ